MNLLVITGASAGIGLATAARFLAEGWGVINLSRRPCPLDNVTSLKTDLSTPGFAGALDSVRTAAAAADQVALIHNAALLVNDRVGEVADEDFRRVLEINIVGPSALNALLLPVMKPGSCVLYVGSTLSEKAVGNSFSYVTSKHAQAGMMKATCQDLAGRGVHTALVCPGFTDTEMLRTHVNEDQDVLAAVAGMSAYNRLVDPAEIASTLWFAASSPVINGTVIHANLGQIEA